MSTPLHTMTMQKIAVRALNEALDAAGIPRTGLFLMGNMRSVSETGHAIWECALHREGSDTPVAVSTACVDRMTGAVSVKTTAGGHPPWQPGMPLPL